MKARLSSSTPNSSINYLMSVVWIGDRISNNSPTVELALLSLGDMFCASVVSMVIHVTNTTNFFVIRFNH
jgi:hypothetical protein